MDNNTAQDPYTPEEKLALIAEGMMAPEELGLASQEEAQLQILGKEPPRPVLGDFITFECSEVPHALRAHWARKEETIIPANPKGWEADWAEANAHTHRIQARLRCGSAMLMLDQTFTDVIPGFIALMRQAADMLEKQYAMQTAKVIDVATEPVPPSPDAQRLENEGGPAAD